MIEPVLSIRELCVDYISDRGPVRAIDSVCLDVAPGEIMGIAGESGCGKSTMAKAIMRILPPPAVISGGEVWFEGLDILTLGEPELRELRWKRIAMVFQSAMDALNPVISVGEQIIDTLEAHDAPTPDGARERAGELLDMVGISRDHLDSHAHQLSGGMRQRVNIALAMALDPTMLILDEPTTALDVIVEKEILEEIRELHSRLGFVVLFITHDLARMLEFTDRVAIFYAARIVEVGPSAELRRAPQHPYTQGLLRSFPSLRADPGERSSIPGAPPSLLSPPTGCRFHPRCDRAMEICSRRNPDPVEIGPGHVAACHLLT
ncbi:MAG: ABC transporter ATP-binding protein [bacterium]|jgi:peptide/nickel transport system ATP-binding protein